MSAKPKPTEAAMFALLKRRLVGEEKGNGPAHVLIPQVRSNAGFDSRRTIDAVGMGLWPSRGMWLTGYEIKCSRADWLNELKNPAKAEEFCRVLDFFTLVVADADHVLPGELPERWGLLAVQGGRLVQKVEAKALRDLTPVEGRTALPEGFRRGFLVALLRQAARQGEATPEDVRRATEAAVAQAQLTWERETARLRDRADVAERIVRDFEHVAKVQMKGKYGYGTDPAEFGRAVRMVLGGTADVRRIEQRFEQLRGQAEGILKEIDHLAGDEVAA